MNETEQNYDPRRLIADAAAATRARRADLVRVLVSSAEPEPSESSLDQLADAVADRVAAKLRES